MFAKRILLVGCFLGSGAVTVPSLASDWVEWQHPGFHGGNGMLDVSVLTRKNVDWAPNRWKLNVAGGVSCNNGPRRAGSSTRGARV